MKSSLIILFLALATAIHSSVTGNPRIRARLDNEAERAGGMADAVTPEYKKAHGVTPELEAVILADGSGGQGTNSYYESFAPVNLTKRQVVIHGNDDLAVPINPQPLGHIEVTVTSGGITVAASSMVTTTPTSKISICTSQEHPPWIPSLIRPTGTESVRPHTPPRSPYTTITLTFTTPIPLPIETVTTSHIPSSNPVCTTIIHPTPSFVTTTLTTSGASDGPVRTSTLILAPTGHPSDAPVEATTLDPIPKHSPHVAFVGPYPTSTTGHEVGTVSIYPIPTRNSTTIIPTVTPPTTLVTRARALTTTTG